MLKFHEIGNYKNSVNIGFCKATAELHNGMVVKFDKAAKTVSLPSDATAAGLAIVHNAMDRPELDSPNDYVIAIGQYPRIFTLASLVDRLIDMDTDQVTTAYASIGVGDTLIPATTGKWVKAGENDSAACALKVIEKTSYGGEGLLVQVVITAE